MSNLNWKNSRDVVYAQNGDELDGWFESKTIEGWLRSKREEIAESLAGKLCPEWIQPPTVGHLADGRPYLSEEEVHKMAHILDPYLKLADELLTIIGAGPDDQT